MLDYLYNTKEVYTLEKAIASSGISMALLMQRAGYALFQSVPKDTKKIVVLIGPGNNGGDGIVSASFLKQFGFEVVVIHISPLSKLSKLSNFMHQYAKELGVEFRAFSPTNLAKIKLKSSDVIIDAIFGIGLSKAPLGDYKKAIVWINQSSAYTISADIPSGLSADTGVPLEIAVKANITCQFLSKKQGLYSESAANYTGKLFYNNLGIDDFKKYKTPASVNLLTDEYIHSIRKIRSPDSHKGMLGHVLIIGGDTGMGGASMLNSIAALKNGAGKVTLLTQPEHVNAMLSFAPEVMVKGVTISDDITNYLEQAQVIVIGSGMSVELQWSKHFFELIVNYKANKPKVFDAGILHYLAKIKDPKKVKNIVLTPHIGEASSLLKKDNQTIQNNRFSAIEKIVNKYHATVILKGKGSLIQSPNTKPSLCPIGNPYMATAGSGDILTGMVAANLAQGYSLQQSAELAVWDHASRADQLVKLGKTPIIASEILSSV